MMIIWDIGRKNELSNWKKKCPIERIIKTLYSEGYSENDIVQHKNFVLEEIEMLLLTQGKLFSWI